MYQFAPCEVLSHSHMYEFARVLLIRVNVISGIVIAIQKEVEEITTEINVPNGNDGASLR